MTDSELFKINVIGTGSSGNAYELLFDDGYRIGIDAGLKYTNPNKINQLFISHEHKDHCKYLKQFDDSKTQIITYETKDDSGENWYRFPIQHAVKNYGYYISYGKEKIGYLTDVGCWYKINERLRDCTYLFVECNFDVFRVRDGLLKTQSYSDYAFSLDGHNSNLDCLNLINSLEVPPTCKIILIHKSKEHSCKDTFKMFDSLPNPICIAEDNQTIMCKSWKIF